MKLSPVLWWKVDVSPVVLDFFAFIPLKIHVGDSSRISSGCAFISDLMPKCLITLLHHPLSSSSRLNVRCGTKPFSCSLLFAQCGNINKMPAKGNLYLIFASSCNRFLEFWPAEVQMCNKALPVSQRQRIPKRRMSGRYSTLSRVQDRGLLFS